MREGPNYLLVNTEYMVRSRTISLLAVQQQHQLQCNKFLPESGEFKIERREGSWGPCGIHVRIRPEVP